MWTEESLASFSKLCSMLSCAEFLIIPTGSDKLLVQCFNSWYWRMLVSDQKWSRIAISFLLQKLTDCESRYSATELECLAVLVECLRQFEAHLDGHHFQLQTDHKALTFLNKSKLLNKRLAR